MTPRQHRLVVDILLALIGALLVTYTYLAVIRTIAHAIGMAHD